MSFGSKAPAAPDYAAQATAQGAANTKAAIATSKLNNPNVINPYGTQTVTYADPVFDQSGWDKASQKYSKEKSYFDSATKLFQGMTGKEGRKSNAPVAPDRQSFFSQEDLTPTITQTFSPEQQALYDKQVKSQGLLGDLSIQGAESLKGVVGKEVDFSGVPGMPGGSDAIRDQTIEAMMGRYDNDAGQRMDQTKADLIAKGLQPGTEAYEREMGRFGNQRNDAFTQAQLAGGTEASRSFGMDMDRRRQGISELLAQRQTPLNEINALMSGSQVSNPFAGGLGYQGGANVAPAPMFQAGQAQYGANVDQYNAKVGGRNSMMQGLFGLASGGLAGGYF